ncbi:MAG: LPS export ABC transporter permease LptF [Chromatiales bacterium]|nr:LPS export ABC transporter permease LptF [Chromatiales bacterium]
MPVLTLDRYIAREILYTLAAVLSVLLIVFISNRFIRFLAEISNGLVDASSLFVVLGLKTLGVMVILLPIGFFMAVLLTFSRMYKDSEMTALYANGVSVARIYRPVMIIATLVAVLVGWIAFQPAPWAEERSYQIRDTQQANALVASATPGRFTRFSGARAVFYFRSLSPDGQIMYEVFGRQLRNGNEELVLSAERGYIRSEADGAQRLVFENGHRYEGVPGARDFRIVAFREHSVLLKQPDVRPSTRKQGAMPTSVLIARGKPADIAELQWRLSMPLSVLVLALLAVPLSRTNPRQGKYAKLFVAVLVYLLYNNLMGIANAWVAKGTVSPLIGMWWVHALMLLGAWLLFAYQHGLTWTLSRMRALVGAR